jgi:glycosyltransferase involved in cell wall biosynthesis
MAVYNEEAFLEEAVNSVLAQTFGDFELLISDDGSTDATLALARRLQASDARIHVIVGEENQGKPFALNRALAACRGDYIAWLDGDDVMLPDKLLRQVEVLDARPSAAGCTHDAVVFDSDTGVAMGRFSEIASGGARLRSGGIELLFDPTYKMLPSATMIRASCRPASGFDERLTFTNDWMFDIEVFRNGECVAIDDVLVRHRRHADNFTSRADASGVSYQEGLRTMEMVREKYPELSRGARAVSTAIYLGQVRKLAKVGQMRAALGQAAAAARVGGPRGAWDIASALAYAGKRRRERQRVPFPLFLFYAQRVDYWYRDA